MGTMAPNINIADKIKMATITVGGDNNLLCPAQAYPKPAFRWFLATIKELRGIPYPNINRKI